MVTLKTNFGDLVIELFEQESPVTVRNFLEYVKSGFYNGTLFHRVIPGFMIQGGGFDTAFEHKDAKAIKGEFLINGVVNNIKHKRGVLSMARTNMPNSASSQFFIMHADSAFLDGQYAAFGKVTEGIEIVDKIAAVKTGSYGYHRDVPREAVIIESITVEE